jgi:hypothetical protein
MLMACLGCHPQNATTVPAPLVGLWESADGRYAGRYLAFSKKLVTFGTGRSNEAAHYVRKVESAPSTDNGMVYTLHCRDEAGAIWQLTVIHYPVPTPSLRLGNQRVVWQPSGSMGVTQ